MKIAVCFSGQMRTALENFENIKEFLGELYDSCDFFVHVWDLCEYKTYNVSNIKRKPYRESEEKSNKIRNQYQPKKMIFDNIDYSTGYKICTMYGIQPLWYSFWKSIQLKKQYEIENGFEYDYVIKLRFDTIFNPDETNFKKEIESTTQNIVKLLGYAPTAVCDEFEPIATDVLFLSKSKEMNVVADYFWELVKKYDIGSYKNLPYYLIDLGIEPKNTKNMRNFCILRDEFVPKVKNIKNKLELYNTIKELEEYYYDSKNDNCFINDLKQTLKKDNVVLDENKLYFIEDIESIIKTQKLI